MDWLKEKEFCKVLMVIYMKVIGEIIKKKEKEFFILLMVIFVKVIGEMVKWKEK